MAENPARDAVIIERTLDAPVELVWQMWTTPEHFKAWYGPDRASIPVANMDVRVGGARRVCMEVPTPDGQMQMWFAGEYLEVVEHERLVYTEFVSDEHGNVPATGVGADASHPTTTEVRIELQPAPTGTKMTLTHVGVAAESPGAAGWAMALNKLAATLASHTRH